MTHYDVDLRLDPATGELLASATISATRLAEGPLVLDELGLKDLEVSLPFVQGDEQIEVEVEGDEVALQASWRATANPFFGLVLQEGTLYTTNEPSMARQWLLCADDPADKATLAWTLHAPADQTVAAIGDFIDVVDEGDTRAWSWRMDVPTPTYLYAFHVADFELTVTGDPIPVWTWARPDRIALAQTTFGNTYDMLEWFGGRYGPYSYSRYGNVVAPMDGAMENPGAVTFGDSLLDLAEWAELLNAHELGHHWWGDDVTPATWDDIWLNEGFATYTEALWYERAYGDEGRVAYAEYLTGSWLESGETGPVYAPDFLFGSTVYDKGGMVVHMLRGVLGDDAFFTALQEYEERFRHANADTVDLQSVMEEQYGDSLGWFFDEWVYGNGTPTFTFGSALLPYDGGTQVRVRIEQEGVEGFRMPIPVRLLTADGPRDEVVWVEGERGEAVLCVEAEVTDAAFDPESWVLWGEVRTLAVDAGEQTCVDGEAPADGCGCATTRALEWWVGLGALAAVRRRRG